MKKDDRFTTHKKIVNPNSWTETAAHLDHAAGEYEPLSTSDYTEPENSIDLVSNNEKVPEKSLMPIENENEEEFRQEKSAKKRNDEIEDIRSSYDALGHDLP
ncbi:hypothetical protein ACFSFY_01920 [Sporosarcina siberiensis]|uniref:Uncharacterized protein n=1 Tax=Sporosarcina siberiensis TaxID=1365606 RepID=A0ABW4SDV5_9BACL